MSYIDSVISNVAQLIDSLSLHEFAVIHTVFILFNNCVTTSKNNTSIKVLQMFVFCSAGDQLWISSEIPAEQACQNKSLSDGVFRMAKFSKVSRVFKLFTDSLCGNKAALTGKDSMT